MILKFLIILIALLIELNANDRAVRIIEKMKGEQRVALVIGNNDYQGALPKLHNPINDARAIRDILIERGFKKIIYREDATKREMQKALNEFYRNIRRGGVGFFYFSGHGIEVDGRNYLIPIDANIEEKSDTVYEAFSLDKITARMQNAKNRLNIVVLDACRNDPFSRAVGKGGLAKMEPIGLFISFSTGAGQVASDGRVGENGLFTKSLIKYMQKPLKLQDVFRKTREEVYEASNQKQFPAIYDQTVKGDFYFTFPDNETLKENIYGNSYNYSSIDTSQNVNGTYRRATRKSIRSGKKSFEKRMDDEFEDFVKDMEEE